MRELFVYYRVPPAAVAAVQAAVQSLHAALQADMPQLRARLLRRPDADPGGEVTCMETYAVDPPDAFGVTEAMQTRIEAAAARQLAGLVGPRHVEVFVATSAA